MHRQSLVMAGHDFYPDKAQVGRFSAQTKRQVSFNAIMLNLTTSQYLIALFYVLSCCRVTVGCGGDC